MKNDVDFTKIYDKDKLLGALNFNNMIPVDESVLRPLELRIKSTDSPITTHYKKMTAKQLNWCQQNQDAIVIKANKLYRIITQNPEKSRNLTRRCCDFRKLETVLSKRLAKGQCIQQSAKNSVANEHPKPATISRKQLKDAAERIRSEAPAAQEKKKSHEIE